MFGVEDERHVHRPPRQLFGHRAVEQAEEVPGLAFLDGLRVDAPATGMEMVPVEKHGVEYGQKPVRHLVRTMLLRFRLQSPQDGTAGAEYVHGMGPRR